MLRDMGHLQTEKIFNLMVPMVIPIPEVKPKVTETGNIQSSVQNVPAPSGSKRHLTECRDQQSCQSKLLRNGIENYTNAAVGPETLKRDPPVRAMKSLQQLRYINRTGVPHHYQ